MRKFWLFFAIFLVFFQKVFAQKTELSYPKIGGILPWQGGILDFLRYFYQVLFGLGVVLALSFFVWGGFLYIISGASPTRIERAKSLISSSLVGLLILFASYVVLSALDPSLTVFNLQLISFQIPKVKIGPSAEPTKKPGCYKISIEKKFEAIHKLEKESLSLAKEINSIVFKTANGKSTFWEIIKKIQELTKQCTCHQFESVCIKPDAGCPECPAFCPPSLEDPCPPKVREKINELLEQIEKMGIDVDVDLIGELEKNIQALTKIRKELEKDRREVVRCLMNPNTQLLPCSKAKTMEPALKECQELDFYCCY